MYFTKSLLLVARKFSLYQWQNTIKVSLNTQALSPKSPGDFCSCTTTTTTTVESLSEKFGGVFHAQEYSAHREETLA